MSILLTSPAWLLALPAVRWGFGLSRLVTGATLAVLIVAFVNLMHFSQGWVQFGYRFALDFAPWALLLVAIGLERVARRTDEAGGVAASVPGPTWPGETPPDTVAATPDGSAGGISARAGAWALVALGVVLVAASVAVNLWGVVWGDVLGW
jgi:hypothetical protein